MEYKKTKSLVLMTFTDSNPKAKAGDFKTKVTWGGAVVGKPTLTVKEVSHTKTTSTWKVLGSVAYTEEGTYGISVAVHDKTGHARRRRQRQGPIQRGRCAADSATPKKTYKAVEDKATGSKVLAVFKDGNPKAKLSDFTPTVTWGGTVVGTPTVSVKLVSRSATASTWEVLGSAVYKNTGRYAVSVSVKDVGGSALSSTGKTTFSVAATLLVAAAVVAAPERRRHPYAVGLAAASNGGHCPLGGGGAVGLGLSVLENVHLWLPICRVDCWARRSGRPS